MTDFAPAGKNAAECAWAKTQRGLRCSGRVIDGPSVHTDHPARRFPGGTHFSSLIFSEGPQNFLMGIGHRSAEHQHFSAGFRGQPSSCPSSLADIHSIWSGVNPVLLPNKSGLRVTVFQNFKTGFSMLRKLSLQFFGKMVSSCQETQVVGQPFVTMNTGAYVGGNSALDFVNYGLSGHATRFKTLEV